MAAYVIGIVEVQNPEDYKEYARLVPESLEPYGGRFLARGGNFQFLEGDIPANRVVIIEFDSYEKAQEWYNSGSYQAARLKRMSASKGNIIVVQGV